jgi:hypothetical protein
MDEEQCDALYTFTGHTKRPEVRVRVRVRLGLGVEVRVRSCRLRVELG